MNEKNMKKKLYVSFTGLLYKMKAGEIVPEDLKKGIFYFGCTKDHLEHPIRENNSVINIFNLMPQRQVDAGYKPRKEENIKVAERIYNAIKIATEKAESEGRADFREDEELNRYEKLNKLLEANGIDVSTVKHLEEGHIQYMYQTVVKNYSGLVEVVN